MTYILQRWMLDDEAIMCPMCRNKFNQLRRKHHCRQCGKILCSKCCKEKVPLPQLGLEEPERICEICRPVTEMVTKSYSPLKEFLQDSAKCLSAAVSDSLSIKEVVELGGLHTLIYLAKEEDQTIRHHVVSGLHVLSMHEPLHPILAEAGAIKALCSILSSVTPAQLQTTIDGTSALMLFCKSADLKKKAIEDGALQVVLSLCEYEMPVSLLSVRILGLIVEHPGTHQTVAENNRNTIPRILQLIASEDEQMQEVALKTLVHLSSGKTLHRHKIVQDELSAGCVILKAIRNQPRNLQVLNNAVCLIANLAIGEEDQNALRDHLDCVCDLINSQSANRDLITHATRAIGNFAKFKLNANQIVPHIPDIILHCLKSRYDSVQYQSLRIIIYLLAHSTQKMKQALASKDGSLDVLEGLVNVPGMIDSIQTALLQNIPEVSAMP
ncbi:uncharacterized protein LOC135494590 isoform X2 [Lineus longissimus]|uniref:uncharacterized protein LOC135494590 isoform X2 n=1 Tax=Lineus longissimus TaxID=88925 RepID=UPI00315DE556